MERALARHPTFRERVFTPEERAYCDGKARPAESYAGRFAAREAVIKALGGYRGRRWQDISVTRAPSGAPAIALAGDAKARASELDRGAQARGVPAETLMERAGRETARIAVELAGGRYGRRAVVVCGKGNNGGDGFVAARYLAGWGLGVLVMLLRSDDELREPAATNLARLRETGARIRGFTDAGLERELARADVVVDAIFGTGFRGTPKDPSAAAIGRLEATGAPVVSVDIPSGVNGESGAVEGPAVSADVTATFGALKAGLVLLPGAERTGIVEVVDIGFPPDVIHADLQLVEAEDVAAVVPRRAADTHKRASGVVLVIGGGRAGTGGGGAPAP